MGRATNAFAEDADDRCGGERAYPVNLERRWEYLMWYKTNRTERTSSSARRSIQNRGLMKASGVFGGRRTRDESDTEDDVLYVHY